MAPTVILIRHGATALNDAETERLRGWADVPLNNQGKIQAEDVGKLLRHVPIDKIYYSNLSRTRDTAAAIAKYHPDTEVDATVNLRPWDQGELTGKPVAEYVPVMLDYIQNRPTERIPGSCESFEEFKARMLPFFAMVAGEAQRHPGAIVLVTHSRGARMMRGWIMAGANDSKLDLQPLLQKEDPIPPGGNMVLEWNEGGWHEANRPFEPLGKSELLTKSVRPEDLKSIYRALDPTGPQTIDHIPHLTAHPVAIEPEVDAYKRSVLESPNLIKPEKASRAGISGGVTRKVVYNIAKKNELPNRFMVKPYHERPIQRTKNWVKFPIQGWAEMANQALYHAAGIGNLHQKVHVSEHDFGHGTKEPTLVVHLKKYYHPEDTAQYNMRFEAHPDIRKIAMMDFLTGNLDRHGGNLLRNAEDTTPMAIDHSRSFQYIAPHGNHKWTAPTKRPRNINDAFINYHKESALESAAPFFPYAEPEKYAPGESRPTPEQRHQKFYDREMEALRNYVPIFDWWNKASPKVREEFENQLKQIKDMEVQKHVRRNFNARADWLDERAKMGLENYGVDWYKDGPPVYMPGQKSDEEIEDERREKEAEAWRKEYGG